MQPCVQVFAMASSKVEKSPVHVDKRSPEALGSAEEDHCVVKAFKKLKLDAEGFAMASSVVEKSPVHVDKRSPEALGSAEEDHCVVKAFKKLKLDAEGLSVEKAVDHEEANLKHKSESTATSDQGDEKGQEEDVESWAQSFQSFCLCDKSAVTKRGRQKWKAMCHYQLHMRKDRSGCKNKLNFVEAGRSHRPVLQESHLKVIEEKSDPQVIQSASFNFSLKSFKLGEETGASALIPTTAASASSKDSKTPTCENTSLKSGAAFDGVFAERCSQCVSDFSALVLEDNKRSAAAEEKGEQEEGPSFSCLCNAESRDWCERSRGELRKPDQYRQIVSPPASPPKKSSETAATEPELPKTDRPVLQRSCSQEARMEEVESDVNELISFFDHYFVLPKKMSPMAEMMYA